MPCQTCTCATREHCGDGLAHLVEVRRRVRSIREATDTRTRDVSGSAAVNPEHATVQEKPALRSVGCSAARPSTHLTERPRPGVELPGERSRLDELLVVRPAKAAVSSSSSMLGRSGIGTSVRSSSLISCRPGERPLAQPPPLPAATILRSTARHRTTILPALVSRAHSTSREPGPQISTRV